MTNETSYLLAIILVLAGLGILLILRRIRQPRNVKAYPYGMPRLAVLDDVKIDKNRRMLLVRRDNVEHLLLIGGNTDVVVEQYAIQEGADGPSVQLGAIDRGEKGVEQVESKNRIQLDRKTESGEHSAKILSGSNPVDPPGGNSENKPVDKIPPVIDELLNSQSKTSKPLKNETEAHRTLETLSDKPESAVKDSFTSELTSRKPNFKNEAGIEGGKSEPEETVSAISMPSPESTEPSSEETAERKEVRSSSTFSSEFFQSGRSKSDTDASTVKETSEQADLTGAVDSQREKEPASTSWTSRSDSKLKPAAPEVKTKKEPVVGTGSKPTNQTGSFLSSLNEPDVQEESESGPKVETPQANESQSTDVNADPAKTESGPTEDEGKNEQKTADGGGSGIERPRKSDDDVFDSIGEEMTKILQELRKNSSTSPPAGT